MAVASFDNDIVRRGYLNMVRNPKDGVLGTLTSGKRYWVVLKKETPRNDLASRIELYRDEQQATTSLANRQIILDAIKMIHHADQRRKKAFEIQLEDECLMFICGSHADVEDWIGDIRRFRNSLLSASFSADLPDNSLGQDLYEDLEEPADQTYSVELRRAGSLKFHGECQLKIEKDFDRNLFHITLLTKDGSRLIVKWQIDHVRQYGSNLKAFKFQSGSKSSTGVDWFIVDTEIGDAPVIHKTVDYWAKHIVDQVKNVRGSLPSRSTSVTSNGSLPRHSGSFSPTSPTSPPGRPIYQPLNPKTRRGPEVYDNPFQGKGSTAAPPRGSLGSSAAPLRPPRKEKSHYQELNPSGMTTASNGTYQSLTVHSTGREPAAVPRQSPQPQAGVYQDLNPRTRDRTDESDYMGLTKGNKS